ncbi:hypothetical protein EI94DRAFT_1695829 [Lactarius quietus]|nr:hypothetical protein EI94DRAFT_1695829 [Lactarius quietus]
MTQGDSLVLASQQREHEGGSGTFDRSSSPTPLDCHETVTPGNGRSECVKADQFEDDEIHHQLHLPLHLGKEMQMLCMTRLRDTPGEFTMEFHVVDANFSKISIWLKAQESVHLDFGHARCISLVCYSNSTQDIRPYAIQQGESHKHEFEIVWQFLQPVPCTKIPPVLLFLMNDEVMPSFPLEASRHLLDISQYVWLGQNKLCFLQADSMSEYVLVLYSHYPTESQIEPLHVHWDVSMHFRQAMAWLNPLKTVACHNLERQAPDAMDLDWSSLYCFMCGNGGELVMCNKCSRTICIGSDTQCLGLPETQESTLHYKDQAVSFICPPCHQDGDWKAKAHSPYYVHPTLQPKMTILVLTALRASMSAEVCGSAQLLPWSRFLSAGIAILNVGLGDFHFDTGDLGKILEPFAAAFVPKAGNRLLIFEDIAHKQKIHKLVEQLKSSATLKTVIILITTHAEDSMGYLATSSKCHVAINMWISQVITKPILDIICKLDMHWFFFCCGALVNVTSSFKIVESFANEQKPTNLFAFNAPDFHPIYALA